MKESLYSSKQEVLAAEEIIKMQYDDQIKGLYAALDKSIVACAIEKSAREAAEMRLVSLERKLLDQVREAAWYRILHSSL